MSDVSEREFYQDEEAKEISIEDRSKCNCLTHWDIIIVVFSVAIAFVSIVLAIISIYAISKKC